MVGPAHIAWLRFALVATLALGQSSGLAHFLLVPHVYCADHGTLVHPEDEGHEAHSAEAADPHRDGLRAASHPDRHAHHHCGAALWVRDAAGMPVASGACDADARPAEALTLLSGCCRTKDVWRVAPKQSPPLS